MLRFLCAPGVIGRLRLADAPYVIYVERIGREPAPMRSDYRDLVCTGDVWVATDTSGRINGVLVLRNEGNWLLLENVAVDPRSQGHGIGRSLVAFAEQTARDLRVAEVRLYTNEQMI